MKALASAAAMFWICAPGSGQVRDYQYDKGFPDDADLAVVMDWGEVTQMGEPRGRHVIAAEYAQRFRLQKGGDLSYVEVCLIGEAPDVEFRISVYEDAGGEPGDRRGEHEFTLDDVAVLEEGEVGECSRLRGFDEELDAGDVWISIAPPGLPLEELSDLPRWGILADPLGESATKVWRRLRSTGRPSLSSWKSQRFDWSALFLRAGIREADDPDGGGEEPEDPDGGGEEPEDPDGGGEEPEDPDGGGEEPEDPDGGGEEPEDPDGGGEEPEDPDGGGEEDCSTEEVLCLLDDRYLVRASWHDYSDSLLGLFPQLVPARVAEPKTDDSGLFWFFSPNNWEILVKVLDGCAYNGRVWVYGASTTDQGYTIDVKDTLTGALWTYIHNGGAAPAITDSSAFPGGCDGAGDAVGGTGAAIGGTGAAIGIATESAAASTEGCRDGDSSICLLDGRYEVSVDWSAADGRSGAGMVADVRTGDSGLIWFFGPDNWEMLVKVLDGCELNGHHWVFAASATDLGLHLTVRDTMTGAMKVYRKEAGPPATAVVDVGAFANVCSAQ